MTFLIAPCHYRTRVGPDDFTSFFWEAGRDGDGDGDGQ